MERGLQELGMSPAVSIRENNIPMDGEDCIMVTKSERRRRKASSSFPLNDQEAHSEWVDININRTEMVESPQENISPVIPDGPSAAKDDKGSKFQSTWNYRRCRSISCISFMDLKQIRI
jgi:hypothetical protein